MNIRLHTFAGRLPILLLCLLLASPATAKEGRGLIVLATGPETTELLRQLGEPLALAAELPPKEVRFHVVLDANLNAFALPNRNIVLNSGLLLAVRDRDELAGVMAHEIGHLKAGHHLQLESMAKKLSVQNMITMAAGILAGVATGSGDVSRALITGGSATTQTVLLDSLRRKEGQADAVGVDLLARAGFKPEGLAEFMNRLVRQQQIASLPAPYLLTHPISTERLMDTRRMAQEIQNATPLRPGGREENQLLARAQAILEAAASDSPDDIATQFRNRLRLEPDSLPLRQGLAEALRSAGRLPEADTLMTTLIKGKPKDPYLLRNRGLVRIELGQFAEAEADLRAALHHLPDNPDLLHHLAFALKERKKPTEAARILRKLTTQYPDEPRHFYLLGLADGEAGRQGEGHIAMGRYHVLTQDRQNALWHFQEAVRLLPPESPEQAIAKNELIQARKMEQPREMEPEQQGRKKRR